MATASIPRCGCALPRDTGPLFSSIPRASSLPSLRTSIAIRSRAESPASLDPDALVTAPTLGAGPRPGCLPCAGGTGERPASPPGVRGVGAGTRALVALIFPPDIGPLEMRKKHLIRLLVLRTRLGWRNPASYAVVAGCSGGASQRQDTSVRLSARIAAPASGVQGRRMCRSLQPRSNPQAV